MPYRVALAALVLALSTRAFAQDEGLGDTLSLLGEEDVVESASRHKQAAMHSPSAVTVFTREQIEQLGVTSWAELLSLVPGTNVQVFSNANTILDTRAVSACLVLIDGREANTEWFGEPFFELLPISLDDVERVEVLRGGASALYGPNAVGAVINITTRKPVGKSARAGLQGGLQSSHRTPDPAAGAADASFTAGVGQGERVAEASYGFTWTKAAEGDRLDLRMHRARLVAEAPELGGQLRLEGGVSDTFVDFYSAIGTTIGPVLLPYVNVSLTRGRWTFQSYYAAVRADLDVGLDLVADLGAGPQLLATLPTLHLASDTFDLQATTTEDRIPHTVLVAGLSARASDFRSTNMRAPPVRLTDPPGGEQVQARAGGFAQAEVSLPADLTAVGAARADWNSQTGFSLSPRGSLLWEPSKHHTFYATGARSVRKPGVLETTFFPVLDDPPGGTVRPEVREIMELGGANPNLPNERFDTWEAGWRGRFLDEALATEVVVARTYDWDNIYFDDVVGTRTVGGVKQLDPSTTHIAETAHPGDAWLSDSLELSGRWRWRSGWHADAAAWATRGAYVFHPDRAQTGEPSRQAWLGGGGRLGPLGADLYFEWRNGYSSGTRNPDSTLAPRLSEWLPAYRALFGEVHWAAAPGGTRVRVGVDWFVALGRAPRVDLPVSYTTSGTRFGGEALGSKVTLFARAEY